MFEQFVRWARDFDTCTTEQKKMIISRLVTRIELHKDYELSVELNEEYQKFCENWVKLTESSIISA